MHFKASDIVYILKSDQVSPVSQKTHSDSMWSTNLTDCGELSGNRRLKNVAQNSHFLSLWCPTGWRMDENWSVCKIIESGSVSHSRAARLLHHVTVWLREKSTLYLAEDISNFIFLTARIERLQYSDSKTSWWCIINGLSEFSHFALLHKHLVTIISVHFSSLISLTHTEIQAKFST